MGRALYIYRVTDRSTGEVLGTGTASELVELGLYQHVESVPHAYRLSKKNLRARRLVERIASLESPPPPVRSVKRPQPLDEDVHRLELLNAERRQQGKPALSYGRWKAGLRTPGGWYE